MSLITPSRAIRLAAICMILVCTAGCDQVTKHLARTELDGAGSLVLPGHFLEFTLAENPGAFLSLGASLSLAARTLLTISVSLGLAFLLSYLLRTPRLRLISFFGLALIWSGGISNLIDRLARHGVVSDFMVVRAGPLHTGIFNLADFAIVAGVVILAAGNRTFSRQEI